MRMVEDIFVKIEQLPAFPGIRAVEAIITITFTAQVRFELEITVRLWALATAIVTESVWLALAMTR
jgi:hypothetical protein